ncbi:MAG: hypothetical protein WBM90_08035 [Acidimicrobiia bacterium]
MKRFSPLLVVAAIAAVVAMALRNSGEEAPPPESWKPVEPS